MTDVRRQREHPKGGTGTCIRVRAVHTINLRICPASGYLIGGGRRVSAAHPPGERSADDPAIDVNNGGGFAIITTYRRPGEDWFMYDWVTQPRNAAHAPCLDCLSDSVPRASINNTTHVCACIPTYTHAARPGDGTELGIINAAARTIVQFPTFRRLMEFKIYHAPRAPPRCCQE